MEGEFGMRGVRARGRYEGSGCQGRGEGKEGEYCRGKRGGEGGG